MARPAYFAGGSEQWRKSSPWRKFEAGCRPLLAQSASMKLVRLCFLFDGASFLPESLDTAIMHRASLDSEAGAFLSSQKLLERLDLVKRSDLKSSKWMEVGQAKRPGLWLHARATHPCSSIVHHCSCRFIGCTWPTARFDPFGCPINLDPRLVRLRAVSLCSHSAFHRERGMTFEIRAHINPQYQPVIPLLLCRSSL